jgi:hypothetical protein
MTQQLPLPSAALKSGTLYPPWRAILIYILPALGMLYVVLSWLWLVPDTLTGMYGNHDGQWASWNGRGILKWGRFLDFSPFSPLVGTGSLFLPNLPWLNPGALALAIPGSLAVRHLLSMLVYLAELSASLYLLYRTLEFSRVQSFVATILYFCIFVVPSWAQALPWFTLAPVNAHLIAMMNVATVALIRIEYERLIVKLLFAAVFLTALFVAFASAPITATTYVPVYAVLWAAFLIPSRHDKGGPLWRFGAVVFALLILGLIGIPSYLSATAGISARSGSLPPIFYQGSQLLTFAFWWETVSDFAKWWSLDSAVCQPHWQLMCPSAVIGWLEIAALAGGLVLLIAGAGTKRRYGLAIVVLLVVLHVYALLHTRMVLGQLHLVSTPYLMWAFFPLAPPAVVAAGSMVADGLLGWRRARVKIWLPAAASFFIAAFAIFVWLWWISPYQPRLPGRGPLGLPPIAHIAAHKGPIVEYLERHIGLKPGSEFRGYAATFFDTPDGVMREVSTPPANDIKSAVTYYAARDIMRDRFGNTFQEIDLWNSDIPTLEEYGQWVSKQMFSFGRDLLADPQDHPDALRSTIHVYRFRPLLLRSLGVRFVIADGTLTDPLIGLVMTETGKAGAAVNLYEIKGANVGQFSPTQLVWVADYSTAIAAIRNGIDPENSAVMLGPAERQVALVRTSRAQLVAVSDGYRFTAAAPGMALAVLPVQFSNCWKLENTSGIDAPRILRANVVQTGILFKDNVDARLRFDFEPWRAACRLQDVRDLKLFGIDR